MLTPTQPRQNEKKQSYQNENGDRSDNSFRQAGRLLRGPQG